MKNKPTPETDAEHAQFAIGGFTLDFCRKLERERDEARERAAKWESSFDAIERAGAEQARRADENREWALRAERERDEAIADRDILRIDAQREAEHHDRMVGELERVYKERDEAREQLSAAKHFLEKYIAERDEARKTAERYRLEANAMMLQRDQASEEVSRRKIEFDHLFHANELAKKLTKERDDAEKELRISKKTIDRLMANLKIACETNYKYDFKTAETE